MLCIVFVAGGNLVVYATEDELTNEVDEANENRFSEKSPWLDHADESIYSEDIDAGETPQQIEPKDPGIVEKYASELIRNATSSLISLLEGKMGAGIDRIIYGRVGSGKPNSVNIYAFELRSGNPYGVTASVCYALLRSIVFVLLGIYFVSILAKSAWTGHTAQNRERIMSIDNANRIVYVSHQEARLEKRPEIEAVLERNMKENTPVAVKGKVLKIQTKNVNGEQVDSGVWLDLCGVGIPGFVYIGNWKKTFTENLRGKVFYGDIVDVLVTDRVERKNGVYYFACSRKELVQDPWESQELNEKYHKGDIVRIRCISKRENNWFGQINGLEDIQVFAEYPSSKHNFAIVPGMEYMGTIYYINPEEHSLKARVFQALSFEQLDSNCRCWN